MSHPSGGLRGLVSHYLYDNTDNSHMKGFFLSLHLHDPCGGEDPQVNEE